MITNKSLELLCKTYGYKLNEVPNILEFTSSLLHDMCKSMYKEKSTKFCDIPSLTEEQLKRLYDVFDFKESETIVDAYFEDNQLYIEYREEIDRFYNVYEPHLDLNNPQDVDKIIYVLTGRR